MEKERKIDAECDGEQENQPVERIEKIIEGRRKIRRAGLRVGIPERKVPPGKFQRRELSHGLEIDRQVARCRADASSLAAEQERQEKKQVRQKDRNTRF